MIIIRICLMLVFFFSKDKKVGGWDHFTSLNIPKDELQPFLKAFFRMFPD